MITGNIYDWSAAGTATGSCIRPGGTALTERALKVCDLKPDSPIADIGCGKGGTLEFLKERGFTTLMGLDYSASMFDKTVPHNDQPIRALGKAECLPFKGQSFHGLFCECVLSLLEDRNQALDEFTRVLDTGGFLVMSDLYSTLCESNKSGPPGYQAEGFLEKSYLIDFLSSNGFTIHLWEDHKIFLKEYAARLILAGDDLPLQWVACCKSQGQGKLTLSEVSYFLLVAQKIEHIRLQSF